jgi:hypothetical protein
LVGFFLFGAPGQARIFKTFANLLRMFMVQQPRSFFIWEKLSKSEQKLDRNAQIQPEIYPLSCGDFFCEQGETCQRFCNAGRTAATIRKTTIRANGMMTKPTHVSDRAIMETADNQSPGHQ